MEQKLENNFNKDSEIYHGFQAQLQPAPWFKRFLALSVDYGILGALSYVYVAVAILIGTVLFGGVIGGAKVAGEAGAYLGLIIFYIYLALALLGMLAFTHGYFIYFEYKKGHTPGKKLFGLTVVTLDGSPRTRSKMVIREVFRYVDLLIAPGLISMAVTDKSQRLGDLMAGTFVAHSKIAENSKNFFYVQQADYNYIRELTKPSDSIEPAFMNEYLLFASKNFLTGMNDYKMMDPQMAEMEKRIRPYFGNPAHERLDSKAALLFFAEHCFQLDLKKRNEEKG